MTDELEPINIEELFVEFADMSMAELMVTIRDLRIALEQEKKAHSYDELKLKKAEEQIKLLTGRINSATTILNGEADICIDCAAVNEQKETKE